MMVLSAMIGLQSRQLVPVEPPRPAPVFQTTEWINGPAVVDFKRFRGKVVLVHFTPTFCCGYDYAAKMVKEALRRYSDKGLAAVGLFSGTLDRDQREIWHEVQRSVPVTWPVGIDKDDATARSLYPGEDELKFSFCFVDRKGNLRKFRFERLEDVYPATEKLLSEPG